MLEKTKTSVFFLLISKICMKIFSKNHPTISRRLNHNKPVEHHDPTVPPTFEFPVFEAEDESEDDVPDEITRLLEQEERAIQPQQEEIELINLGTEDNKREIKVGAALEEGVKKRIFQLLREYSDIFAWSYEDMPGLDP